MPDSYRLLPGLHLVRRDADAPPARRRPAALRGAARRAGGTPPASASSRRDAAPRGLEPRRAGRWPRSWTPACWSPDDTAARRERLRTAHLRVEAPAEVAEAVTALLRASAGRGAAAPVAARTPSSWSARASRSATASTRSCARRCRTCWSATTATSWCVGPFVVPGATACLRCVDCHHGDADPRRGLVVEQVATQAPLRAGGGRTRACGRSRCRWAVRDLVTFAEGGEPATWSATIRVTSELDLAPRRWLPARGAAAARGTTLRQATG